MKIAYLLSQYPAVNHAFMLREVRLLRALGFDIQVASVRPPDRPPDAMTTAEQEEAKSTYYVKRTGAGRLASAHWGALLTRPGAYLSGFADAVWSDGLHGLFYFMEAVVVGHWMRKNGLTHVHTHYASTVAFLLAQVFPVTLSITIHGPAEFDDVTGFRLRKKVETSLFTCAISQYGRSQIMATVGHPQWAKLELTPLGVDPADFPPRPFRVDPSPFQIICVGRLAPVKGQHVLLEAMERLVRGGRNIRLWLAGDGPDRAELQHDAQKRGLGERVVFEGNINQDRLRALYSESDALVLSSFAEGLPVVLMEAMAMEIPCVAPWVNGIPEIITHDSDGLLVPPGNAEALADAIGRLMDDVDLRRSLGQKARGKVLEKFNLQRNTEHLAEIFSARNASPGLRTRESS